MIKLDIKKVIKKILIIGVIYGPLRYIMDKIVGYRTIFPDSIFYHCLRYLLYIWLPAIFVILIDSIILGFKLSNQLSKVVCVLFVAALFSFSFFNGDIFEKVYTDFITSLLLFFILGIANIFLYRYDTKRGENY
jgi:hypothetical protein